VRSRALGQIIARAKLARLEGWQEIGARAKATGERVRQGSSLIG
jgi:hypothetical protein